MILALCGALIIGLSLGMLGSGGSILTVPILVYALDRPEKLAIAESLAIVGTIALAGVIPYAKRRLIDWKTVAFFGLPGILGVSLGALGTYFISDWVQMTLFAFMLVGMGIFILFEPASYENVKTLPYSKLNTAFKGISLGCLTGLLGIGGGVLIVPALMIFCSLPIHFAIGTSLVIIVINSLVGFTEEFIALHFLQLHINWHVILLFSASGILGCIGGSFISKYLSRIKLKKILACGIFTLGTSMLFFQFL